MMRRVAIVHFGKVAGTRSFRVAKERLEHFVHGARVVVQALMRTGETSHQPRINTAIVPHRGQVLRRAEIRSAIGGVIGRERSQTIRRHQLFLGKLDDRARLLAGKYG